MSELIHHKRAINMLCDIVTSQRAALIECGVYLSNVQQGKKDGFNAACRAVEKTLFTTNLGDCEDMRAALNGRTQQP